MQRFATKDELAEAWVRDAAAEMVVSGSQSTFAEALTIARLMVRSIPVYVPHLYRGGWVIRGFGFSMERIGKLISLEEAGNPLLV